MTDPECRSHEIQSTPMPIAGCLALPLSMEMFIDAYDWVMVPNVCGMSQYADGRRMTSKPYISGSGYVLKMSDFKKDPGCAIWDALYRRFVDRHSSFFAANPRMSVMVRMKEKLGDRMLEHYRGADEFIARLHG